MEKQVRHKHVWIRERQRETKGNRKTTTCTRNGDGVHEKK